MHINNGLAFFPLEIPSPPIGLKVDSVYSTSISISWQPPYDAMCIIREYQVSYTMQGGSEQLHEVQDTTSSELTSLEPHTEYTICVRAKTVHFGDYCTPITIHTLETGKMVMENHCFNCSLNYFHVCTLFNEFNLCLPHCNKFVLVPLSYNECN